MTLLIGYEHVACSQISSMTLQLDKRAPCTPEVLQHCTPSDAFTAVAEKKAKYLTS